MVIKGYSTSHIKLVKIKNPYFTKVRNLIENALEINHKLIETLSYCDDLNKMSFEIWELYSIIEYSIGIIKLIFINEPYMEINTKQKRLKKSSLDLKTLLTEINNDLKNSQDNLDCSNYNLIIQNLRHARNSVKLML